jgi:hypothetical protein
MVAVVTAHTTVSRKRVAMVMFQMDQINRVVKKQLLIQIKKNVVAPTLLAKMSVVSLLKTL